MIRSAAAADVCERTSVFCNPALARAIIVVAAITRFYSLFSLRSGELIQGFLMQTNLSQVSLRFFNVVLYGVQLFPDCNLTSMIQRGLKALDAKCSTCSKGISLLYFVAD